MTASKAPKAPAHLSPATAKWWLDVVSEYELEPHHVRILTLACEAWDRCTQAREVVERDGITTTDRFGQMKPHPAVAVERDSRTAFARMLRELALDVDGPAEEAPRMPTIPGRANLRVG